MTKISSVEPPTISSGETTNIKGQPSPAAHLDEDGDNFYRHVMVSLGMLAFFGISAAHVWYDGGHHWYDVVITAIVFLHSTVMIHLLLIRRRNQKKRRELQSCDVIIVSTPTDFLTSVLTVVATGIMLISLGIMLFVFRPAWSDLALVAFTLLVSLGAMFLMHILEEINRKNMLLEKSEDASDLA